MDLLWFFYVWIPCFSNTIGWRSCLFSNVYFWFFCQTLGSYNYMGLFLGHRFSSIHLCLFFVPEPCCFLVLTVWLCCIIEMRCFNSPVLLFQIRIVLVIYDLLCFHVNFRFFFPISVKTNLEFWWGLLIMLLIIMQPCFSIFKLPIS